MQWMKQILINFFSLILSQMQALMLSGTSAIKFWEHPAKVHIAGRNVFYEFALHNFGDTKAEKKIKKKRTLKK